MRLDALGCAKAASPRGPDAQIERGQSRGRCGGIPGVELDREAAVDAQVRVTIDVVLGTNRKGNRLTGASPLVVFFPIALVLGSVMRHLVR
jgi:hypothetical protein